MSLFGKLRHALSGPAHREVAAELEALRRDRRLHVRYNLNLPLCRLTLANGQEGTVVDISYGGLLVSFPSNGAGTEPIAAKLTAIVGSVDLTVTPVRPVGRAGDHENLVGLQIAHTKPDSLLFMREMIEPIRCGSTLVAIAPDMRRETYRSNNWQCYRGEGPVDFIARTEGNQVQEALMTFLLGPTYGELMFKEGLLKTGRTENHQSSLALGANVAQTNGLDIAIVRHAIFIMLGAPAGLSPLMQPMLQAALTALSNTSKTVAA